ncbi:hypothetical protein D3C86_1846330 [compost metagenome]
MCGGQAFNCIGGTVVDFDFPGILQNHAPGENNIIAEAAAGFIGGFRREQRRSCPADNPARIMQVQQHNACGVAFFPAVLPAVFAPAAVQINRVEQG